MELKEFKNTEYSYSVVQYSKTLKALKLTPEQERAIAADVGRQIEWACESYLDVIVNNIAVKKKLKAPLRVKDYKGMLAKAVEAIEKLKTWAPESGPGILRKCEHFTEGDEDAPFFTETFLYLTLGKEDARTLLAYMRDLAEAVGGVARHEVGF